MLFILKTGGLRHIHRHKHTLKKINVQEHQQDSSEFQGCGFGYQDDQWLFNIQHLKWRIRSPGWRGCADVKGPVVTVRHKLCSDWFILLEDLCEDMVMWVWSWKKHMSVQTSERMSGNFQVMPKVRSWRESQVHSLNTQNRAVALGKCNYLVGKSTWTNLYLLDLIDSLT